MSNSWRLSAFVSGPTRWQTIPLYKRCVCVSALWDNVLVVLYLACHGVFASSRYARLSTSIYVKDYRNGSREHSARGAVNWALPSKLQVVRSRSFPHPVSEMHLFSDYLSSITHVHILVNVLLLLLLLLLLLFFGNIHILKHFVAHSEAKGMNRTLM